MNASNEEFASELARADQRIARGSAEQAAGADERAIAIEREVARRPAGGVAALAGELGVSRKTISQALARARNTRPHRGLPADTLQRLLSAERAELDPLPPQQWDLLERVLRDVFLDPVWVGADTGDLMAGEVEDSDLGSPADRDAVAATCRGWSRVQALAVLDACQQGLTAELPRDHAANPPGAGC